MGIGNITFNPSQDDNVKNAIDIIEKYLNENSAEMVLKEISRKIYFDDSVDWREILVTIFKKNDVLTKNVPLFYIQYLEGEHDEILPQYTYLITFLISENLLDTNFISKEVLQFLKNKDAKYILMSFLTSWNLEKAMELDYLYIEEHYRHKIEANRLPLRKLLLEAAFNDAYLEIINNMLEDTTTQYHFNQEIQRIIKNDALEELRKLEKFIEACNISSKAHVIEFVTDLLEMTTVQNFLMSRWNFTLTERVYKNFATNNSSMSDHSKKNSLNALNRLKRKLKTNFAVAARYEINKLSEVDKQYILQKVEGIANMEIYGYNDNLFLSENEKWDWKDYAFDIVRAYKEKHSGEDVIDVRKLAEELGIKTFVKKMDTNTFDACLVRDSTLESPVIIVNSLKKSKGRVNFSIAHEIAHAVLPHHAEKSFFCFLDDVKESNKFKMNKNLEMEANNFAAYILLPEKQFKEDISSLNFTMESVSILSKKYSASLVLVAKKWVELSNLEIAMVFSTNGITDWWTKSDNFPYKYFDFVIDKDSSVFKSLTLKNKTVKKKTSFNKWFDVEYPISLMQEESYKIFDEKVLTLLQIIDYE